METEVLIFMHLFKSHMEDFVLIIIYNIVSLQSLGAGKNLGWIFVQNPMQMDLVQ